MRVELRKLADTRAGKWLLIAIVAITALIIVIFFLNAEPSERTFINFMGVTATPQGFLLPVLGILLVTSEWIQRTALVTFTLVPVRGQGDRRRRWWRRCWPGWRRSWSPSASPRWRPSLGGADNAWANIGLDDVAKFGLLQVMGVMQGLAFGLLFLNSAAAIVIYFVLPIAFSIVANLWGALKDAAPWVDLSTAQQPLFGATNITGEQWLHIATATAIWVVLPFVLGLVRVLRAEVK